MARYIVLSSWTDQGIKSVKDSPSRLDAARGLAKKLGGELKDFYMTVGGSDMAIVADMPDDETMAKFALTIGMAGNIRTTTMKAFSEDAYRKIVAAL